ncbi:MAG: polymer-forming cytoskeletal protein [Spirochaetales bacterium]|nr:polymer-forming cytoskeletal protein [Spirochaetales bacterium]
MAKTPENTQCVIGEGSVFDGRFYVNGSILIEGKFQGDIKTDEQLIVGPTGKVKTDITAKKVTIAGTIIGNITATEEVSLLESGKVFGNITTPRLVVEAGVITEGKVVITAGKNESLKHIIEQDFGQNAEDIFKTIGQPKKPVKKVTEESSNS